MDNFYQNQREIDLGERDKLDPTERQIAPEPEEIPCDQCGKLMDEREHYVNSGLCFGCIENI